MAKKEKKEEQKKGAPEWMTTYSDMVTLLLCFFVLLFAMSSIDAEKWRTILEAFTGAPSVFTAPASTIVEQGDLTSGEEDSKDPEIMVEIMESDAFERLYQGLRDVAEIIGDGTSIEVTRNDYEITVRFMDNVLFDSGKADLRPGATEILDEIMIRILPFVDEALKIIRIEGHTDNLPINTVLFPNNWWLSTHRAGNVLMYILNRYPEVNPALYSSQGRGEYHPIDTNETEEGRAKNRRVELILVRADESVPVELTN